MTENNSFFFDERRRRRQFLASKCSTVNPSNELLLVSGPLRIGVGRGVATPALDEEVDVVGRVLVADGPELVVHPHARRGLVRRTERVGADGAEEGGAPSAHVAVVPRTLPLACRWRAMEIRDTRSDWSNAQFICLASTQRRSSMDRTFQVRIDFFKEQ